MSITHIPANYYQHFDANFSLDVPGEGYGGWKRTEIEIDTNHTAFAVMHAWDCSTRDTYPGWHRAVEYIPRADKIGRDVFPPLLSAIRNSDMKLIHIASAERYCEEYSGFHAVKALETADPALPSRARISPDAANQKLREFRTANVFPGLHNLDDIAKGHKHIPFMKQAVPHQDEYVAVTSHQVQLVCEKENINHLIYMGFAIDGCLLSSSGGMLDMSRAGIMCSAIRQGVTAIENSETARTETCKQVALWRVALFFGFVFDDTDIIQTLSNGK